MDFRVEQRLASNGGTPRYFTLLESYISPLANYLMLEVNVNIVGVNYVPPALTL